MKLRVLAGLLVGLAISVAQILPAHAAGATAVVSVFTGTASVANPDLPNQGLCLPVDHSTVGVIPCDGPATANYGLDVPGVSAPLPAVCLAAGVFEGNAIVAQSCELHAHGTVTGTISPLKPSCGLSHGQSDDALGANTVTLNGITRNVQDGWVTSAGGTIPVTGSVDDGAGGSHVLAAIVQARPITPSGTVACVNADAKQFIIVGVAAVAA